MPTLGEGVTMPYHAAKSNSCPPSKPWAAVKDATGEVMGCHASEQEAQNQVAALYANEPEAKMSMDARQQRAQALREQPGLIPAGSARSQPFPSEMRTQTVRRDGKELVQLEGYASVVEKPYAMWDKFGPYEEVISAGAFDRTLAGRPDVAFLVNHRGVTMARTTNGTLELSADSTGLHTRAFLNPERVDVHDLILAIEERNISEMSFAFKLPENAGRWAPDFSQFRINDLSMDRGDVSAVNYGANPYTSVAARAHEILADLEHLPAGAASVALARLRGRADLALPQSDGGQRSEVPAPEPELQLGGMSLTRLEALIAIAESNR